MEALVSLYCNFSKVSSSQALSQARVGAGLKTVLETIHPVAELQVEKKKKNLTAFGRFSPKKKRSSLIWSEKELFQNNGSQDVVDRSATTVSLRNFC